MRPDPKFSNSKSKMMTQTDVGTSSFDAMAGEIELLGDKLGLGGGLGGFLGNC